MSGGSKPRIAGGRISLAGVLLAALPTQEVCNGKLCPKVSPGIKNPPMFGGGYRYTRSFEAPGAMVKGWGGWCQRTLTLLRPIRQLSEREESQSTGASITYQSYFPQIRSTQFSTQWSTAITTYFLRLVSYSNPQGKNLQPPIAPDEQRTIAGQRLTDVPAAKIGRSVVEEDLSEFGIISEGYAPRRCGGAAAYDSKQMPTIICARLRRFFLVLRSSKPSMGVSPASTQPSHSVTSLWRFRNSHSRGSLPKGQALPIRVKAHCLAGHLGVLRKQRLKPRFPVTAWRYNK